MKIPRPHYPPIIVLFLILSVCALTGGASVVEDSSATSRTVIPQAECEDYLDLKDYTSARVCFEERINKDPTDNAAFRGMSMVFQAKNAQAEGRQWFDRYLVEHSKSAPALYGRGYLLADADPKQALSDAKSAIQLDPQCAWAWNLLGFLAYRQAEFSVALDHYQRALEIRKRLQSDPKGEAADLAGIGKMYWNLCDYPMALSHHTLALEIRERIGDRRGMGESYDDLGVAYADIGDYPKALAFYAQALEARRRIGNPKGEAATLNNMGVVYSETGDYKQALANYTQALKIKEDVRDLRGQAILLNNIGVVHRRRGDGQKAMSFYEQSLKIREQFDDKKGIASTLTNIGVVHADRGDYQTARSFFDRALAIRKRIRDRKGEGEDLTEIGNAYLNLGDYPRALSHHEQALQIRERIDDKKGKGENLNTLGVLQAYLGDTAKALSYYDRALDIRKQIGNKKGEAGTLINLGVLYADIVRDDPQALRCYRQALTIKREIEDVKGEGTVLNNMGVVHRRMGDRQQALSHYFDALKLREKIQDKKGLGSTLTNVGEVYADQADYQKALAYYHQALEIREQIGDKKGQGEDWRKIGDAHCGLGDQERAISCYEQAVAIAKQIGDSDELWRSLSGRATVLAILNRLVEAAASDEEALAAIDQIAGKLTGEQQAGYMEQVRWVYEEYIGLLYELQIRHPGSSYHQIAFQVAERGKARDLRDAIAERRAGLLDQIDSGLAEKEIVMRSQIANLHSRLSNKQVNEPERKQCDLELFGLERQLSATVAALRENNPRLAQVIYPTPLTIQEVRRNVLRKGEALLEYYTGCKNSYLFVVTNADDDLIPLGITEAELYDLIYGKGQDRIPGFRDGFDRLLPGSFSVERAKALYRQLIGDPLKSRPDLLAGVERLVIVPHGPLHGLPFEALVHDGDFLADHYEFRYGPSSLILRLAGEQRTQGRGLLAIVNPDYQPQMTETGDAAPSKKPSAPDKTSLLCPLPEIENIGRMITKEAGSNSRLFTGKQATKSIFKRSSAGRRLIFIGTHGYLDAEHPMYSTLVFTKGANDGEDGLLRAYEVFGLNLNGVELVTLAACRSGEGKPIGGSLQGLSAAFLGAGAKGLAVSLWPVDERATALLMKCFYKEMRDGLRPAEALRRAKQELRALTEQVDSNDPGRGLISYDAPFYWAGFIYIGK